MKKKFSLGALFQNNRFVLILSVVASIITWFAVSISISPIITQDVVSVPIDIPLASSSFSNLKAYKGADTQVTVKVQGKKYILSQVKADDIIVTASLTDVVGVGTYNLSLSAKKRDNAAEFDVVSVSPSTANVMLDNEAVKEFEVEINCIGATVEESANENEVLVVEPEFADIANATLTVQGADSEVKKVAKAVAVADVNEQLVQTKQFGARIVLYDEAGNVLHDPNDETNSSLKYVQTGFSDLQVVAHVNMIKTVPLNVELRNAPESPPLITIHENTGSTSTSQESVKTIRIKGTPNLLADMKEISLDGVLDFSTINFNSSTWEQNFTLPNIPGIQYVDYKNVTNGVSFTANINKKGLSTKTYDIPTENIIVSTAGQGASVQSALKGVQVIGPSTVLRSLKASQIKVNIDATNYAAGSYTIRPDFTIGTSKNCWVVGNYEVTFLLN